MTIDSYLKHFLLKAWCVGLDVYTRKGRKPSQSAINAGRSSHISLGCFSRILERATLSANVSHFPLTIPILQPTPNTLALTTTAPVNSQRTVLHIIP